MSERIRVKLNPKEKAFLRAVVRRWVKDWPVEEYGEPVFSTGLEAHGEYPIYDWMSTKWDGDSYKQRWVFAAPTITVPSAGYDLIHSNYWSEYKDYDWKGGDTWKVIEQLDTVAKLDGSRRPHGSEIIARYTKAITNVNSASG
jgi:hypothetical protein